MQHPSKGWNMARTRYRDDVVEAPPRRRSGALRFIALLVALAVIGLVVLAVVLVTRTSDDAKDDVTVSACNADPEGGDPTASGQIVNDSSKTSNYVIRLRFNDAQGNGVSEGVVAVDDVDSGATAQWELTGTRSAQGPLTCEVTDVSRTHLPGQD
jgi:hypothetical protein